MGRKSWKADQPTIPYFQGQVSSNKLNYRLWFILEGGFSNETNLFPMDKTFDAVLKDCIFLQFWCFNFHGGKIQFPRW